MKNRKLKHLIFRYGMINRRIGFDYGMGLITEKQQSKYLILLNRAWNNILNQEAI